MVIFIKSRFQKMFSKIIYIKMFPDNLNLDKITNFCTVQQDKSPTKNDIDKILGR